MPRVSPSASRTRRLPWSSSLAWTIPRWCVAWWVVAAPRASHGFAAWLVERESACWTDLATTDAIMGSRVVAAADSRFPGIALRVERVGEDPRPATTTTTTSTGSVLRTAPGDVLRVSLERVPDVLRSGLQFVAEVSGPGASFSSDTSGCDGRRAFGRVADQLVLRLDDDEDQREDATVWAGWAAEHEAVTLTPVVTLRRSDNDNDNEEKKTKQREETREDVVANVAVDEREHTEERVSESIDRALKRVKAEQKAVAMRKIEAMRKALHPNLAEIRLSQTGGRSTSSKGFASPTTTTTTTTKERDDGRGDFGSLSTESFALGCALMIAFGCSVALTSGLSSSSNRSKGRRDL